MAHCAGLCMQEALDSEEVADADGLARSSSNISQMSEIAGKCLGCQNHQALYGCLAGAVMLAMVPSCLQDLAFALLNQQICWSKGPTPASRHVSTASLQHVSTAFWLVLQWLLASLLIALPPAAAALVRANPTHPRNHSHNVALFTSCDAAVLFVCRPQTRASGHLCANCLPLPQL